MNESNKSGVLFGAIVIFLLAWWCWAENSVDLARILSSEINSNSLDKAAKWGDSFGPFNALVSTAGLAFVIITLRQQQKSQHRQQFETHFFELMRLMRELRAEVRFRYSAEYATTRDDLTSLGRKDTSAFRAALREMVYWLIKDGNAKSPKKDELVNIYMRRVHSKSEATLGAYFRIIYNILDRLRHDRVLSYREKVRYANLLRGQLTSYEVILLGVNGLAPISKDMSTLLVSFKILKYVPNNAWRRRLLAIYDQAAFSSRD